jgi:hypothetical protein
MVVEVVVLVLLVVHLLQVQEQGPVRVVLAFRQI